MCPAIVKRKYPHCVIQESLPEKRTAVKGFDFCCDDVNFIGYNCQRVGYCELIT
jgi:hypothetical protein